MNADELRSAIIVPVTLPSRLSEIREGGDRLAALGVPAHVSVLFPFLPPGRLTRAVHAALSALAAAATPFRASFRRVERRDGMIWLVPSPATPFLELTATVVERWPDHPPYGGIHARLIPHLTLLESDDPRALEEAAIAAEQAGRFDVAVTELQVITQGRSRAWHRRWRFGLGPGPGRDGSTLAGVSAAAGGSATAGGSAGRP
jgi:hypothetical protein